MMIDAARGTFFEEAQDLLRRMEEILLAMEAGSQDGETVNSLFRAAHTIKGSAGLFGFDEVVAFTHIVESVLDCLRGGTIGMHDDLVGLLLDGKDHIGTLVAAAASNHPPDESTRTEGRALADRLTACLPPSVGTALTAAGAAAPEATATLAGRSTVAGVDTWHISLRFDAGVLRMGMDPLAFIHYLTTLGDIVHLETLSEGLPGLEEFDPEACYLGFEIDLNSTADRQEIEAVFEFVRNDAQIRILPPDARVEDYIALIDQLPEDAARLGEILIAGGALTQHELEQALRAQAQVAGELRLGEILAGTGEVPEPVIGAALDKQRRDLEKRTMEARYVKVPAENLDRLIDLVGELVIAGAGTQLLAHRARLGALAESASHVTRLVEEVRDAALRLRMVQIGEVFGRFPRVVRDVSRELGKVIELQMSGAETELDKSMVDRLADPLMHLVRNAMDHGLETTAERLACGKPACGTVSLAARHESGSIIIEVRDDGRGLDRRRILEKALARGLVQENQSLTDEQIWRLIMLPGFSTAAQVTNLSGRGVGMDVVKSSIEALRGTIDIESRAGEGSCMRLTLPLTLAIIDGFLTSVGQSSYVIPLDNVIECLELRDEDMRGHVLDLRGEVLPFIRLRDFFGIEGAPPRRENVVVIAAGGYRVGIVVDRLLGEFQTVIKPLGSLFQHLRGIGGSTILGSGEAALILDVQALTQLVSQYENRRHMAIPGHGRRLLVS